VSSEVFTLNQYSKLIRTSSIFYSCFIASYSKAGWIALNAGYNEQVFLLPEKKNLAQIRLVVFEKNAKNAP